MTKEKNKNARDISTAKIELPETRYFAVNRKTRNVASKLVKSAEQRSLDSALKFFDNYVLGTATYKDGKLESFTPSDVNFPEDLKVLND